MVDKPLAITSGEQDTISAFLADHPARRLLLLLTLRGNSEMVASGPLHSGYDWKPELLTPNLDLEFLRGSWLYETSHLVMLNVPQAHKCVTPEDLTRRFERVTEISKGRMWAAKPDDVIDYVRLRRAVRGDVLRPEPRLVEFELRGQWPVGVVSSQLSFRVPGLAAAKSCEVSLQPAPISGGGLRAQVHGWAEQGRDFDVTADAVPGARLTVTV